MTRDEAAESLGTTVGAIRGQLERGRALLEKRITKRGIILSAAWLAVMMENAQSAVWPSADLIELTIDAASGNISSAVVALAQGVVPMSKFKFILIPLILSFGMIGAGAVVANRPSAANAEEKSNTQIEKPKAPTKSEPNTADSTKRTISGKTLGPDGKPLPGVNIYAYFPLEKKDQIIPGEPEMLHTKVAVSDVEGNFHGSLPKEVRTYYSVFASKTDYGIAWASPEYPETTIKNPDKLKFKLNRDQPILGRVVDTQGKPLAGLNIGIYTVIEPKNSDIDKLLKDSKDGSFGTVGQWEYAFHPPNAMFGATTDNEGKFKITGLGADRVIDLTVSGKNFARMSGMVVSKQGVNVAPLNRQPEGSMRTQKGRHHVFYNPEPTFVVEPSFAIEGTVTEKSTGKPVARCQLEINTGNWDRMTTMTDAAGKYRFEGLSKGMSHYIHFTPPKELPLFPIWSNVKESTGYDTVKFDVALARGAVFTGQVIDKQTREPIRAQFQILPTGDNDFAKKPEYETASRDYVWKGGDNKFRIITIPGKSKVTISVIATGKLNGKIFHPYRAGQTLEIDLPEVGEKEQIIEVDRGQTAEARVVDVDGKPTSGLVVSGITYTNQDGIDQLRVYKLPDTDSKFTVFGLGEKEKRRVVVLQPDKKLACSQLVKADAKETLKLAALQPLRGTFVDTEGKPLAGLNVVIEYDGGEFGIKTLLREHASKWVMSATTDKDGKFEIPDVIPGLPIAFGLMKGKTPYRGAPRLGVLTVQVGQPLDLGVRKLEEFID